MQTRWGLILVVLISVAGTTRAAGASGGDFDLWQRVLADGRKIGHLRITRQHAADDSVTEYEQLQVQLGKPGRRLTYRLTLTTEGDSDGNLRSVSREVKTREGHSLVVARVMGDDLLVTHGARGTQSKQTIPGIARTLKSPDFAHDWMRASGRGEVRAPLTYQTWDPAKLAVVEITLSQVAGEPLRVRRRVRSPRDESSALLEIDAHGNVAREAMRLGAVELARVAATEAEALTPDVALDHVGALLQKSPYRIPSRDIKRKIRYGFDNAGAMVALPAGAGQRTWTDGPTTWIQVCADCPTDPVELSADERAVALAPTPWLQSADPALSGRAAHVTAGARDAALKMQRLTTYVRGRMGTKIDMLGYGSALEALRTGRGDCTEFAVLLAALGRASGVPTRIAIGMVYARHFEGGRHVFVPHAWVQAYTGSSWESFDAAIGSFDSTHLAFAVSYDGSPANHFAGIALTHELKLRTAARVVPRAVARE